MPPFNPDNLADWFDRRRTWLFAGIAALMLLGFNGQWRIGPDSAIHVTVARNLAEGAGPTHPTGLDQTVQPGLAWLTALTFHLFGTDRFAAIDALMLLCAAGTLALTYWVMRLHFDRRTAVIVVCMLAVNETFYRYGYHVLTDMPFLLGLMLLLLGAEWMQRGQKGWQVYAGFILMLLAILVMAAFRSIVLTVLAAGGLWVIYRMIRGPSRLPYVGMAVTAGGAWLIAWLIIGGGPAKDEAKAMALFTDQTFGETLHRVIFENGPALLTENLPEAMFGADLGPWLGTPLAVLAIVFGIGLFKRQPFWGLLVLVFVVQWLVLITTDRYVLVIMPLLALVWWQLICRVANQGKQPASRWAAVAMLVLWFGPNLATVGEFILEQRARPFPARYAHGQYAALRDVAQALNALHEPGDVIIADNAPQLTYLTRFPVRGSATLPTYGPGRDETLEQLRRAERILLVKPIDHMLKERMDQLKLKPTETLRDVPTPGYRHVQAYSIVELEARNVDWDNYRRRMQRRLERLRAAEQSDGQAEEQTGESEEAADQPE